MMDTVLGDHPATQSPLVMDRFIYSPGNEDADKEEPGLSDAQEGKCTKSHVKCNMKRKRLYPRLLCIENSVMKYK